MKNSLNPLLAKGVLLLFTLFTCYFSFGQEQYSRVKIFGTDAELYQAGQLGITIDHGEHKRDMWFMTDLSATEIQILETNGFNYEIVIEDVQAYYVAQNLAPSTKEGERSACPNTSGTSGYTVADPANWQLGSMAGFYTYQEFLDELDSMASKYPNLITVRAPISTFTSIEGRDIFWVRISDNPTVDEAEEEVLYTALHHAREPASLSQLIYYMWYVLENYGTDDEITYLVDQTEMYFVPMINPDGYIYNQTTNPSGGGMHRKNRRNVGTSNKGVDLNRNYSYHWNESGTSPSTNNDTYAGTAAFTEPETQAIKWFCENHDFKFAFNAHTHGNLLLFPMGWASADFAPDHDYMQAFTNHMAIYNGYTAQKSSALYPAAGDSDDWMYADDLGAKPKIFAMTPECSSEGTSNDFWPPQASIHDICAINIWMNKTLSHMPHIYGVTTDVDPNQIATTTGYFHYEIERLGLEDGDITVIMTPLIGIQTLGSANTHTLNIMDIELDSISYVLNSGINFGDEVKYLILTNNGLWTKVDTITKTFGAGTAVFTDNCTNTNNWTGTWSFTNEDFVSPNNCITDSPFTDYQNNADSDIELNQSFSFQNATYAYIKFNAKWALENDYDYVQFMASTDGGSTWTSLCGKYTNQGGANQDLNNPLYDGFQLSWVLEEINLVDYIGLSNVKFKFHLISDVGVKEDGFYFDDFVVYTDAIDNTGLGELTVGDVNVYPNPASQFVTVQFNSLDAVNRVEVYNDLGELVLAQTPTSNKFIIPIAQWSEGIYIVKTIGNSNQIITNRFTVIR